MMIKLAMERFFLGLFFRIKNGHVLHHISFMGPENPSGVVTPFRRVFSEVLILKDLLKFGRVTGFPTGVVSIAVWPAKRPKRKIIL